MVSIAEDIREERERLVASLRSVGPDAATLAGQWTTSDLASHLAAQDRLHGVPALLARSFVAITGQRLTALYLDRPRVAGVLNGPKRSWARSLKLLNRPPPKNLTRSHVAPITLWEHFVHHEDVLRANGLARAGSPDLEPVFDWILRYNAPRLPTDVRTRIHGGVAEVKSNEGAIISGSLAEVVLWLSGREAVVADTIPASPELEHLRCRLRV